jgi:hypothetical protein
MDPMTRTSLIVAGIGSIVLALLSAFISKILKGKKGEKIAIWFEDGQIEILELSLDKNESENKIRKLVDGKTVLSKLGATKLFSVKVALAIGIFSLFFIIAKIMRLLGEYLDTPGFTIIFRIIELTTLVLGGLLCFTFIFRNTTQLVRFLIKRHPKQHLMNNQ